MEPSFFRIRSDFIQTLHEWFLQYYSKRYTFLSVIILVGEGMNIKYLKYLINDFDLM